MIPYYGDYQTATETDVVYCFFNTFSSDDPSASVTMTGLATTDIEIFKDGSATQRSSDNGYVLLDTDGTDFGGHTGVHGFSIALDDNSDSGFFAAGSEYLVVIDAVTVDGATLSFGVLTFSIGRAGNVATLLTDTEAILTDAEAILVDTDVIGAAGAGLSDITLNAASIDLIWDEDIVAAHETADTAGLIGESLLIDTEATRTDAAAILIDTAVIGALGAGLTDITLNAASIDLIWDEDIEAAHETVDTAGRVVSGILGDTEAILVDTEATRTDAAAVLVDTEAATGVITDTEAIIVDTEANKVITDKFVFTTANEVDSNVHSVNDTTVKGVGTDGDPWNPA